MGANLASSTATDEEKDEEKKKHYSNPVVLRGILSKGDSPEPVLCYEYCRFFGSEECSIERLKKAQQNGFCEKHFKLKIPKEGIDMFEALLIKNLKECA